MAIYKGDCKTCGRRNADIFDDDNQCLTCKRLDNIEKDIASITNKEKNKYCVCKQPNVCPYPGSNPKFCWDCFKPIK